MTQNAFINLARSHTSRIYGVVKQDFSNGEYTIPAHPEQGNKFHVDIYLHNNMGSVGYIECTLGDPSITAEPRIATYNLDKPEESIIVTDKGSYTVKNAVYYPYNVPNEELTFYGIYSQFDNTVEIRPNK